MPLKGEYAFPILLAPMPICYIALKYTFPRALDVIIILSAVGIGGMVGIVVLAVITVIAVMAKKTGIFVDETCDDASVKKIIALLVLIFVGFYLGICRPPIAQSVWEAIITSDLFWCIVTFILLPWIGFCMICAGGGGAGVGSGSGSGGDTAQTRRTITHRDEYGRYTGRSEQREDRIEHRDQYGRYTGYSVRRGDKLVRYDENGRYKGESK